jgi:hypothetical protein
VRRLIQAAFMTNLARGRRAKGSRAVHVVDYRHVISALRAKPAALTHLAYRDALWPRAAFRRAWEALAEILPAREAARTMVGLLALAHDRGVEADLVAASLSSCRDTCSCWTRSVVRVNSTAARIAYGCGLTGANHSAAGAEGRTMRRDRSAVPEQPGLACELGFSGFGHLRAAARYAFRLTKGWRRSSFSGANRAYLGNVGQ